MNTKYLEGHINKLNGRITLFEKEADGLIKKLTDKLAGGLKDMSDIDELEKPAKVLVDLSYEVNDMIRILITQLTEVKKPEKSLEDMIDQIKQHIQKIIDQAKKLEIVAKAMAEMVHKLAEFLGNDKHKKPARGLAGKAREFERQITVLVERLTELKRARNDGEKP